jgi:acyl dehydratase
MTSPAPVDRLYLEDLAAGDRFESGTLVVEEQELKSFAARFDPQPFHLDEAAARESVFGGLAASGWHTAALTMRLLVQSLPFGNGVIGAGTELAWPQPTRPGDVLRVSTTVLEVTPSRSKPDRGIVTCRTETLNQHGECVQRTTARLLVFRRPQAARGIAGEATP